MAVKKTNTYTTVELAELKHELESIVDYLESINVEELADDIDWKVTAKGITPAVVATIEEVLKNAVMTMKESCSILLSIYDKEGMSPYIESNIHAIRSKLKEIQEYYRKRPVNGLTHRRISKEGKPDKGGKVRTVSFIAATQQRQITERTMIIKKVLETLPLLDKLEDIQKKEIVVRGGYELPESMEDED